MSLHIIEGADGLDRTAFAASFASDLVQASARAGAGYTDVVANYPLPGVSSCPDINEVTDSIVILHELYLPGFPPPIEDAGNLHWNRALMNKLAGGYHDNNTYLMVAAASLVRMVPVGLADWVWRLKRSRLGVCALRYNGWDVTLPGACVSGFKFLRPARVRQFGGNAGGWRCQSI